MKFLKPILIGASSVAAVAPIATLTSCNQSLLNGLKGIKVEWKNDGNDSATLTLNMTFVKDVATVEDMDGDIIINRNNVVWRKNFSHSSKNLEGQVTATATDGTIFSFFWSCYAVWEDFGGYRLVRIDNFKVHDIDWE